MKNGRVKLGRLSRAHQEIFCGDSACGYALVHPLIQKARQILFEAAIARSESFLGRFGRCHLMWVVIFFDKGTSVTMEKLAMVGHRYDHVRRYVIARHRM